MTHFECKYRQKSEITLSIVSDHPQQHWIIIGILFLFTILHYKYTYIYILSFSYFKQLCLSSSWYAITKHQSHLPTIVPAIANHKVVIDNKLVYCNGVCVCVFFSFFLLPSFSIFSLFSSDKLSIVSDRVSQSNISHDLYSPYMRTHNTTQF